MWTTEGRYCVANTDADVVEHVGSAWYAQTVFDVVWACVSRAAGR
jgi:hypothetical protein